METAMPNPIRVQDADLRIVRERFSGIHVWYHAFNAKSQSQLCGEAFFAWLPELTRMQHGTIENYWYSVDPEIRNQHVATYMAATARIFQLTAQFN